ncbi:MAG: hypothetical protein JWN14_4100 [Chthonomonadales bacterium]|nr:hypothetical protein [Chthonomonadales bacterium]
MSEQSQRRVVSKGRYVRVMSTKMAIASTYVFSFFLALFTLFGSMVCIILAFDSQNGALWAFFLLPALVFTAVSIGAFFWTLALIRKEQQIAAVLPMTRRNAHLASAEESLMRASDLPSTHPQAELLRATPYGQETPAEELLRATKRR